jgi:hypothetical protein
MNLKFNPKEYLIYLIIIFVPISLGTYYSFFSHDYHHWIYNLSNFYDYKNGFILFKDIFLQYGAGQIIFFDLLSIFIEINMLSIGIITNFIFALNLLFFYFILRKYFSYLNSIFIIILILLIHPFAHYPWPDYYASFCVTLFFYFFLKEKQNKFLLILQGFLLFLAIFFRTSYLMHIIVSIFLFYLLDYFFLKQKKFNKLFFIFFIQLFLYLMFLFINGQLFLWLGQGIGAIKIYTYGSSHPYMNVIISYVGEYGWFILKLVKAGIRWFSQIFNVFKVSNLVICIFLISSLLYIFQIFKKKSYLILQNQKFLFLSFLSILGLIQGFLIYENFRIINSSLGLFFLGLLFLTKNLFLNNNKYKKFLLLIPIYFSIKLIFGFPNNSTFIKFELKDNSNYVNSNYDLFSKKKKLSKPVAAYYDDIYQIICNKNFLITNFSPDFSIPYICSLKYKKNISPYWYPKIEKVNPKEYRRIINNEIVENEIFITSENIRSENVILVKKLLSPHEPMPWYGEYLYIYKKR